MNIGGKEFSEGELRMLLLAVKRVLTCYEDDICKANLGLLHTSIHIGLVTKDECNGG